MTSSPGFPTARSSAIASSRRWRRRGARARSWRSCSSTSTSKVINDGYGHPFGDALLKETACRLGNLMREGDTVARLGGDEFLVLLPNLRRSSDAYVVAQKILDSFDRPLRIESQQPHANTTIA